MTTTHDPIDFVSGDTWPIGGTAEYLNCDPINLAGGSISWKLDSLDGTINYLTLTVGAGILVINDTNGLFQVQVSPDQSAAILPGTYMDSLRVTTAAGLVSTQWTGVIRVAANPA